MADRLEWFSVDIPAGTAKANPITVSLAFNQGTVIEIDVKVPPGPAGNVGFFIASGGTQYVPRTAGSFIVPDGDYFTWPMTGAINTGAWAVTAYNTDIYDHVLQFGFQINELTYAPTFPTSAPIGL